MEASLYEIQCIYEVSLVLDCGAGQLIWQLVFSLLTEDFLATCILMASLIAIKPSSFAFSSFSLFVVDAFCDVYLPSSVFPAVVAAS